MIFRNKDMKTDKNYLFVDDVLDTDMNPIPKEFLENIQISRRGKITSRAFNVEDGEYPRRGNG